LKGSPIGELEANVDVTLVFRGQESGWQAATEKDCSDRDGRKEEVLTDAELSRLFDLPAEVLQRGGYYYLV